MLYLGTDFIIVISLSLIILVKNFCKTENNRLIQGYKPYIGEAPLKEVLHNFSSSDLRG